MQSQRCTQWCTCRAPSRFVLSTTLRHRGPGISFYTGLYVLRSKIFEAFSVITLPKMVLSTRDLNMMV
jgi:hypothetical protein